MTTAQDTPAVTAPRELVSPRMFGRLTRRIMADHGTDQTDAERIMDQALAGNGCRKITSNTCQCFTPDTASPSQSDSPR
jgi:hypothetical protein